MSSVTERRGSDIATVDPKETAGEIHITDAAIKAAERAKDPAAFEKAIRQNLEAKRDFAAHYSATFQHGGDRTGQADSTVRLNGTNYCASFGFVDRTVRRWCERLLEDEGLERAIADRLKAARKRFVDDVEAANYSSESVEWYTPPEYIESAREAMGDIDLDPASSSQANQAVKASKIFTQKHDGLSQAWFGRVFLNPPYGKRGNDSLAGVFCDKAVEEYENGHVDACIILVNSLHSQKWQAPLWRYPVCLVDHRIRFVSGDGTENKNPTFQNAFFYMGSDLPAFRDAFSTHGFVMVPA